MLFFLSCYSNICNRLSETNVPMHKVQTSLGLPDGFLCSGIQFYLPLSPYLCYNISFLGTVLYLSVRGPAKMGDVNNFHVATG